MSFKELIKEHIVKRKLYAQLSDEERRTIGKEILADIMRLHSEIKAFEKAIQHQHL